ncbi:MAG TPA: NrfD/PsrC family molybdoenzyme membrane anchor subunit [Thermodesulfobacteriota bacterium]|nr:NrfD/PsrC family molybdoenzyme membrane anchor subunit [Thermodesulfobacteriota bacterium]
MGHESQTEWGWSIAIEIFCGGTAGGAYILSALPYLIFGSTIFLTGVVASLFLVCISVFVLIAESTSLRRVPRAFSNIKSPLTVGAISLSLFILFSTATVAIPHKGSATGALSIVVWLAVAASLLTIIYPGILMSFMKGIPLWGGSGPSFLLLSAALLSGSAVVTLAGGMGRLNFSLSQVTLWGLVIYGFFLFIFIVTGGRSSKTARISVQWLIKGNLFLLFMIGVIAMGWVVPFTLYIVGMVSSSPPLLHIGSCLILIGGILMRYSLMAAAVRIPLLSEDSITPTYWRYH